VGRPQPQTEPPSLSLTGRHPQHFLPATAEQKKASRDCQAQPRAHAGSDLLPVGAQEPSVMRTPATLRNTSPSGTRARRLPTARTRDIQRPGDNLTGRWFAPGLFLNENIGRGCRQYWYGLGSGSEHAAFPSRHRPDVYFGICASDPRGRICREPTNGPIRAASRRALAGVNRPLPDTSKAMDRTRENTGGAVRPPTAVCMEGVARPFHIRVSV
jgi:hypothetical protein